MPTTVTKTIRASGMGGDYTTLSGWEAGRQTANANLVTADVIEVGECYDDWSTGLSDTVTIDGFTTDATRYLKVTVASGHRHDGTPQTGFFIKNTVNFGGAIVSALVAYTQIEWVDIENAGDGACITFGGTGAGRKITNCLAKTAGTTNAGTRTCFSFNENITVINCLAYSSPRFGFVFNAFCNGLVYNCVAANTLTGFSAVGSGTLPTVKNCVAYNNTTNWTGSFNASSSHNATSTGSDDAPGANSVISIASGDFIDAANNDYHIDTDSALYEVGTDLSGTFTTDIDGDTWAATWSIGFDQPEASVAAKSLFPKRAASPFIHMMVR